MSGDLSILEAGELLGMSERAFVLFHFHDPFAGREGAIDVRQERIQYHPQFLGRHIARSDPEKLRFKHSAAREVDEILVLAHEDRLQPVGFPRNLPVCRIERQNVPEMDRFVAGAGDFDRQSGGQLCIEQEPHDQAATRTR